MVYLHVSVGIQSECHGHEADIWNTTDFCVWGFGLLELGEHFLYWGLGQWNFVIGVLSEGCKYETHLYSEQILHSMWNSFDILSSLEAACYYCQTFRKDIDTQLEQLSVYLLHLQN
mgnify:CR=1 FL=1